MEISIAYQANNKLKYAKKLSTSNNWNVSTIDSAQGSGYDGSMTLDQWQNPHIAYGTDYDGLKYAAFNDPVGILKLWIQTNTVSIGHRLLLMEWKMSI